MPSRQISKSGDSVIFASSPLCLTVFCQTGVLLRNFVQKLTLLLILVVSASSAMAAGPTYKVIGEDLLWQGAVELTQAVLVAAGAELTIAPGTLIQPQQADFEIRVEGAIQAQGSLVAPIRFRAPQGWRGVVLAQSDRESRFEQVFFSGAQTAISSSMSRFRVSQSRFEGCDTAIKLHRQSIPLVENSVFIDNRIAVAIEMRSQVMLNQNRFSGNETAILASHNSSGNILANDFSDNGTGVHLQHLFLGQLARNNFHQNERGIFCDQTMESPRIVENRFSDNRQAIVSLLASKPLIRNNFFSENQQALVNNQLGSPRVEQNLFVDNRIAIKSERRSAPVVKRNQFNKNHLALLCDYLSYPIVKQNNFEDNQLAVKLGEFQSADKEQQGVVPNGMEEYLQESGRQGKFAEYSAAAGAVDVRGNWWGRAANLNSHNYRTALFYDREESQWVVDAASGRQFLRDRISFTPWLSEPVIGAGLE